MRRIVLYDRGEHLRKTAELIRQREREGHVSVVGVSGRELPAGRELEGWPLIPPEELDGVDFDYVAITAFSLERELVRELQELGIGRGRILGVSTLKIPNLSWEAFEALRRRRITIFCNNCWGGVVSHTFGLECCSPTKNLWIPEHEFLRFLEKPQQYLALDPVAAGWCEGSGAHDSARYPLLRLGDITLHCNHDSDPDEAIAKWLRRRAKVNWDDTLAVFTTDSPKREEHFYRLDTVRRKYCFTPYASAYPHSIEVRGSKEETWSAAVIRYAYAEPPCPINLLGILNGEDDRLLLEEEK